MGDTRVSEATFDRVYRAIEPYMPGARGIEVTNATIAALRALGRRPPEAYDA